MKAGQLSERALSLAKRYGLTSDVLINHYFFDAFLARLSKSPYCDRFILKGGYLFSIEMGVVARTTRDLDFSYQNDVDEQSIRDVFLEIINADVGDGIQFNLVEIDLGQDLARIRLLANLEQIKHFMRIDVSLRDIIYPSKDYIEHQMILTDNKIKLRKLSIYYYLSEKIHVISRFGVYNGRAKDYYDLYFLSKRRKEMFSLVALHEALIITFKHRKDMLSYERLRKELNLIMDDTTQIRQWVIFTKKHHFAKELGFNEVISSIIELISQLEKEHSS